MDLEAKFDLLLKTIAENEKKRVEAKERTRAEYLDLKKTVEAHIPAVEKKVDDLGESLQSLSTKVEHLEGSMLRQVKSEPYASVSTVGAPGNLKEEQFTNTINASGLANSQQNEDATWEDLEDLCSRFPAALAWGQANFQGVGLVRKNPAVENTIADGTDATEDGSNKDAELAEDQAENYSKHMGCRPVRAKKPNIKVHGPEWVA